MHHDFSGIGSRCGWQTDNREVGTWLNNILKKGGTEDWRKVLKEATGEDISTRAMMDYFEPLMSWLEEQNKGRQIGWSNCLLKVDRLLRRRCSKCRAGQID